MDAGTLPKKSPTPEDVLIFIARFVGAMYRLRLSDGPTYAHIAKHFGVSRSTAHRRVGELIDNELCTASEASHGAIHLTCSGSALVKRYVSDPFSALPSH